jgi:hypothetical protein
MRIAGALPRINTVSCKNSSTVFLKKQFHCAVQTPQNPLGPPPLRLRPPSPPRMPEPRAILPLRALPPDAPLPLPPPFLPQTPHAAAAPATYPNPTSTPPQDSAAPPASTRPPHPWEINARAWLESIPDGRAPTEPEVDAYIDAHRPDLPSPPRSQLQQRILAFRGDQVINLPTPSLVHLLRMAYDLQTIV